ncbi:unnamed protein product [Vitrella brassicaformis CCMP3155]|uniref:Mitochondrial carrier protein n=2 Tax=Vitrella brassicaformis TaxID=1169539 RepID=A0A0G4GVX0_VITBC|nr:unnamed protein product [Vitrella brassicaformis CCMP3155]|eukprot:CEM35081.1 unnamed protein product [Vitrella brassicaformis CCMP3155]
MMQSSDHDNHQPPSPQCSLVSAALAGMITKTACAPLDRVRTLYQTQGMFTSAGHSAAPRPSATLKYGGSFGLFGTFRQIYAEEGVAGLFRGNLMNCIRAMAVYGIKFGTNDFIKDQIRLARSSSSGSSSNGSSSNRADGRLYSSDLLLAGLVAGTVQKLATYPLDLLTVRLALGSNVASVASGGVGGGSGGYRGILDCVARIYVREGVGGFWKGLCPTLVTGVPYVALQLSLWDDYRDRYRRYIRPCVNGASSKADGAADVVESSVAGSLASLTAQLMVFPCDTIRKRMMADGVDKRTGDGMDPRKYRGMVDCLRQVLREGGVCRLYHGLVPCIVKALPNGAIQFGSLELFSRLVPQAYLLISSACASLAEHINNTRTRTSTTATAATAAAGVT